MIRQKRIRDETGGSVYYDIVESEASDFVTGAGSSIFDIMKNVGKALTGKAAKKMATKAAEKLVEKSAEKVGEKTGQLLGEKIYMTDTQRVRTTRRVVLLRTGEI